MKKSLTIFTLFLSLMLYGCSFFSSNSKKSDGQGAEASGTGAEETRSKRCPSKSEVADFIGRPAREFDDSFPKMKFAGFSDDPPGHLRGIIFECEEQIYLVHLKREWGQEWFSQDFSWKYSDFSQKLITAVYLE